MKRTSAFPDLVTAMSDQRLFGPMFAGKSWDKASPPRPSINRIAPATISQCGYSIDEKVFVISLRLQARSTKPADCLPGKKLGCSAGARETGRGVSGPLLCRPPQFEAPIMANRSAPLLGQFHERAALMQFQPAARYRELKAGGVFGGRGVVAEEKKAVDFLDVDPAILDGFKGLRMFHEAPSCLLRIGIGSSGRKFHKRFSSFPMLGEWHGMTDGAMFTEPAVPHSLQTRRQPIVDQGRSWGRVSNRTSTIRSQPP
jgi:hypothetical protein